MNVMLLESIQNSSPRTPCSEQNQHVSRANFWIAKNTVVQNRVQTLCFIGDVRETVCGDGTSCIFCM